ncbi:MAG: recombinase family protein [Alphaproteobacteria bacterium]|nr:recombinase family protein [Alphaproteobacteria bacterium]
MKPETKNCAIYTRKSTDEGLDTDFNTLDAQREACEAYITSQKAEGWKAVQTQYNDGGYSGGNLQRPGLQNLLADIKEGKVQTVVVYKIDRLTRSLMDFSKLVEIFDEHDVTFVSVTQSFNTTTSMGRLTLNVLLSFAQFEREVSAERIRDKIAASKKKGMWMGGNPPIGYEAVDKKLIVNKQDAKVTRYIFESYLALGCVAKLKRELDNQGITSKTRISKRERKTGGKAYSRGALYSMLQNPIYIGKIRHKEQTYDGQHEAIISQNIWNAVQENLKNQAAAKRGHTKADEANLLKSLLFDCEGTPYSPDHTKKSGKIYRYYISQNLLQYRDHPKGTMSRIPAHEIEKVTVNTIGNHLIGILMLDQITDHQVIQHIKKQTLPIEMFIRTCVNKIVVHQNELQIDINAESLKESIQDNLDLNIPTKTKNHNHVISVPFTIRRAHKGTIILKPENDEYDPFDLPPKQLKNLIRGIIWRDEHFAGMSMKAIADREGLSKAGVQKIVMGSFDTLMSL